MSIANGPSVRAVELPLANSVEFCQAVLDDIELLFRKQHGPRWTPEAQELFQTLRESCMAAAARADEGFDRGAIAPLREAVLLSNYSDGSR